MAPPGAEGTTARHIRLLPARVADAIAAGEVVERPASVVKELVENALDAGAENVSVEVTGAGRTLVRVADDGAGIPGDELPLAFTRHATSKLATVEDLGAIGTLGFRGEALASIAAVADVEARSSRRRIRVRAGVLVDEGAAPPSPGTTVEVRDLFGATPARLKFLKSEATENAAVVRVVATYALAHAGVAFRLKVGGRTALATAGDGDLLRAAGSVWGSGVTPALARLDWRSGADSGPDIRVVGLASRPGLSRGSRDAVLISANNRPISSRALTHAVEDAYRGSLERGRYPIVVVDIAIDATSVDVNVHPTKREVRFHEEGAVFAAVQRAIRQCLGEGGALPYPVSDPPRPAAGAQLTLAEPALHRPGPTRLASSAAGDPAGAGPLRPLGQVQDGYLVAEAAEGLVLVDQHAAHERVLYNLYLGRLKEGGGAAQAMIVAQTVDLDPGALAALTDHLGQLSALGFSVEEFGPRTARILATPIELPPARAAETLAELLDAFAEGRAGDVLERTAAIVACHSAVRFGDRLDLTEQRRLLEDIEPAADSLTCPHGRPTRLVLEWRDLRRHFRRNY